MDANQHAIYYTFGIEPKQLTDHPYVDQVRSRTDKGLLGYYPPDEDEARNNQSPAPWDLFRDR